MIRRDEAATYAAELVTTAAYAAILEHLGRRYEPDWTWLTVVIGTIISTAPAITLARIDQRTSWPDYERRIVAGFLTSGSIIIGWQLWQYAERRGHRRGYAMACRITEAQGYADPTAPLE